MPASEECWAPRSRALPSTDHSASATAAGDGSEAWWTAVRRPPTLRAGLGVVGIDQGPQTRPRVHHLHLRQGLLPVSLLLVGRLLVHGKTELLAHHLSPDLR